LSVHIKRNLIEDIVEQGGDFITGYFPGSFSEIALKYKVKYDTVRKIWKHFCDSGELKNEQHTTSRVKHLQQDDIQFIRFLKTQRPSMTTGELYKHVDEFCNVPGGISTTSIRRTVQNDMDEKKWTWKKMTTPVAEKFTPQNIHYCQNFLDYVSSVDPYKLKFLDEAGIKLPDVGRPNYGHSLIGTPAVEVVRNMNSPNITLNLLCGLDGIIYANTVNGSSNSLTFLRFFEESTQVYLEDGRPPYSYDDHVILDNAAIHHNRAGQALGEFLDDIGCTAVYLPTYSPEFNPAENVFNKLKTILRRYEFRELLKDNVHVAVYEALKQISPQDMRGFFTLTGYVDV
jgi:transposase